VAAVTLPARPSSRFGAFAGIAAPASFITAWVVGGLRAKDYSPVKDAISQLARVDAPTRPLMTTGFLAFATFAPFWARTISLSLDEPRLKLSIGAAVVGTLGVATLPLGASFGDGPHAAAAGLSYLGMGITPAIGGRALARAGHDRAARASYAVTGLSAVALVASLTGVADGGLQRVGLTGPDLWFIAMAVRELRRRA
jgi:hypothetical membrane protein